MSHTTLSAVTVAKASVRGAFLDAQIAKGHRSLASFAHELALAHERQNFGLAGQDEVAEIEDRLVAT